MIHSFIDYRVPIITLNQLLVCNKMDAIRFSKKNEVKECEAM